MFSLPLPLPLPFAFAFALRESTRTHTSQERGPPPALSYLQKRRGLSVKLAPLSLLGSIYPPTPRLQRAKRRPLRSRGVCRPFPASSLNFPPLLLRNSSLERKKRKKEKKGERERKREREEGRKKGRKRERGGRGKRRGRRLRA